AADEDDARRGARAALEMIAEVEGEAESLRAARRPSVEIRIALHTGIVVSRPSNSPATQRLATSSGTTSNIVAQLSATTAPGEIVVSAATQRLLRQHFSFSSQGTRTVTSHAAGATAKIDVYRLELPISTGQAMVA